MNIAIFEKLHADGHIDAATLTAIKDHKATAPLPVRWDLLTLLYTGVFLLTTGLGIIIYKNLDSIGHVTITLAIALATVGCFFYCIKMAPAYSNKKSEAPGVWFSYVLLLGCLLLLILVGYLQFQFQLFGNRWGLATFVPMVVLFVSAYYFDHLGVLSLAITNLATWVGISMTPLRFLKNNDFSSSYLIYSGMVLGIILIATSLLSEQKQVKPHFAFTYKNFGTNLLFIATLAAAMVFGQWYLIWFLFLAVISYVQFRLAIRQASFYFLVLASLYFYVGLGYVVIKLLFLTFNVGEAALYLTLFYVIISAFLLVRFLMHYNKKLQNDARLQ